MVILRGVMVVMSHGDPIMVMVPCLGEPVVAILSW
jgi:hypothetical protein